MRRFIIKTFIISLLFILGLLYFHFTFWIQPRCVRDLSRMGVIFMPESYKWCVDTLPVNHITTIPEYTGNQDSDSIILTIGDSFSQQGIRGYQNYMAYQLPNYQILNIKRNGNEPEELFVHYALTHRLPKIVIVQSVERSCINRLNKLTFSTLEQEPGPYQGGATRKTYLETVQSFYKCKLDIDNPVGHAKLKKPLFSCTKHQQDLFFVNSKADSDIREFSIEDIRLAQLKLDSLFMFAEEHGIELYYLVAMDKYDAYQDKIIDNPYPTKIILDSLSAPFMTNRHFVNPKVLIKPYIDAGELDMYYCDDTHWSTKSAKLVGEELARRISQ